MDKISDSLPKITFQRKRHLQLVNLAGDLAEQTKEEAGALGFMSRLLIMVNLPYRDPGKDVRSWWRKNGNVSIDVNSGTEDGVPIGFPYGAYPRLILAYLITQAVKTQDPTIYLGKSFAHFLGLIGIQRGGKQYKQLHKQLERTLSAAFAWTYRTDKQWSRTNIQVSSQSQLWWDEKQPEQQSLWESYIRLNIEFYNEIMRNTIPLDLRVLATLKNSPLGLDLYMFIAWRTFKMDKPIFISWESLQEQLGGQYTDLKEFSRKCRFHIKRIEALRPDLNIAFAKGRLCLKPSSIF
jgi:Plasmid encoded RepA protein